MEKLKALLKTNSKKNSTKKRNSTKKSNSIKKGKSNTTMTPILSKSYTELKEKVLNGCDLYNILECAKKINKLRNPYIIILSTKTNNDSAIDLCCDIPQNLNYSFTKGTIHKEIKESITNIINNQFNESFDGLVVVLLCIVRIQINNGKKSFKFYYDRNNEKRHVDKLKKDIFYRIEGDNDNKVYMHYFTAIIDNMDTANNGSKPRPPDKQNNLERRVKKIEDKVREKYINRAKSIMIGYFRREYNGLNIESHKAIFEILFEYYVGKEMIYKVNETEISTAESIMIAYFRKYSGLNIICPYQIWQTLFRLYVDPEIISKVRARAQLVMDGYLRKNTESIITQEIFNQLIAFYCW